MDRLSTVKPVLDVKANRVLDEFPRFLLGFPFGIAALQRRYNCDEAAILVAFDHNSEIVDLHGTTSKTSEPLQKQPACRSPSTSC